MGSMGEMFGIIAVTIAIFVGSLGVAALIVVATVMQRDKARRAALK
jgi:ABC-type lipoprotein release transport system permease subunit